MRFLSGWVTSLSGELRRGGQLSVDYDPERVPRCRTNANGLPAWDLWASVRFHPGGELHTANLIQHLEGDPPQVVVPPRPVAYELAVPADATQVELWFQNTDAYGCSAWDSRFGENYWFEVGPPVPAPAVSYRTGAITTPAMVNAFSSAATKANAFPRRDGGPRGGADYQTRLFVQAWVRNVAYAKHVWVDLHVFDGDGERVHSETLPLASLSSAGGGGDFFVLDRTVYQGSVATPGSISPRPDARTVQYRLYVEVDGHVYTDGTLHQHELPEDALAR